MEKVIMPHLGMTMKDGEITKWLKKEGELITEGEVIAEITTEKLASEIIAPCNGTLSKILVDEGETVDCGAELAIIAKVK